MYYVFSSRFRLKGLYRKLPYIQSYIEISPLSHYIDETTTTPNEPGADVQYRTIDSLNNNNNL